MTFDQIRPAILPDQYTFWLVPARLAGTYSDAISYMMQSLISCRCHDPGTLPFEDQVSLSEKTTSIVSFHGTVSYLILFQREKTSAIIVEDHLKETDVILHITSVRVVYMSIDKISEQ